MRAIPTSFTPERVIAILSLLMETHHKYFRPMDFTDMEKFHLQREEFEKDGNTDSQDCYHLFYLYFYTKISRQEFAPIFAEL